MKIPSMEGLTVSKDTVERMSDLLLSGERWTRRSLAETLRVSAVMVGKVAEQWIRAGLLEETVAPIERGRSPRCLRLRKNSVVWGILRMETKGCSLIAVSADGVLLGSKRLPYDDSMSPDGNEAMVRSGWHVMRAELTRDCAIFGLGVITRESEVGYWERSVIEGIGTEADVTERENPLIAEELSTGEYGKTVLYLQPDREPLSLLSVGREWTEKRLSVGRQKRIEAMMEAILGAAKLLPLDCIAAESHGRYEGEAARLLRELKKRWTEETDRLCPKLVEQGSLTLAECAMLRKLNHRLAQTVARLMGQ